MNILLQHWTGELNELGLLSSANMLAYAERMKADYRLLRGNVFRPKLSSPCQKLYMLDKEFDRYETVVMVDMDMFALKTTLENVFDAPGTGLFSKYTERVFSGCRRTHPDLSDARFAYWGGAIYRLPLELRQTLREHIYDDEMSEFSDTYKDEGIVHRLACLAKIKQDRMEERWCQCSYLPNPEKAAFIHIRTKVTPDGPKRPKIDNYKALAHLF